MPRTPVFIICSPRPQVGKTLLARLLCEFQLAQHGAVAAFDLNLNEPSLLDFLPNLTQSADIGDTPGQIALMDRIIANDGVPKVIDIGYPAFESFFRMTEEIGFMKEAMRRGIKPIILFLADRDRASARAFARLRRDFPQTATVAVNNQHVLHGEALDAFARERSLTLRLLPGFLRSIIDRPGFSFGNYLRGPNDPSAELHQWIRGNFLGFRELELNLILHRLQSDLR
ncbi:MAG: hypothetical protein EPO23_01350 [Xanthobacteraceae bacterium]|nr:MAG: hypothetical protein EPO23_01350 [Xanthobacteraceae bacterium]